MSYFIIVQSLPEAKGVGGVARADNSDIVHDRQGFKSSFNLRKRCEEQRARAREKLHFMQEEQEDCWCNFDGSFLSERDCTRYQQNMHRRM